MELINAIFQCVPICTSTLFSLYSTFSIEDCLQCVSPSGLGHKMKDISSLRCQVMCCERGLADLNRVGSNRVGSNQTICIYILIFHFRYPNPTYIFHSLYLSSSLSFYLFPLGVLYLEYSTGIHASGIFDCAVIACS